MAIASTHKLPHEPPARIPFRERLTCTIADATAATGISRAQLFRLIKAGRLDTTMVDSSRLIRVPSLVRLLEGKTDG